MQLKRLNANRQRLKHQVRCEHMSSVCREMLTCYSDCESEAGPVEASGGVGEPKNDRHLVSTKCGHLYHYNCLQDWFMQAIRLRFGQCPICSSEVDLGECWRIYPSRDENTQDLEAITKEAMDTKEQLEKLSIAVDILRSELNAKCEEESKLRDENGKMRKIIGDAVKVKPHLLTLEEVFKLIPKEESEKVLCQPNSGSLPFKFSDVLKRNHKN